jgi:hypothetical protein
VNCSRFILTLRNRPVGGPVVPGRLAGGCLNCFRTATKITFLVHGFNVSAGEGSRSLARLADLLPFAQRNGALVSVLWPGDSWAGAISYAWEGHDANLSAHELAKFIDLYAAKTASLFFVSHSLGARVVMTTVGLLKAKARDVSRACLMAPAIDADSLADPGVYRRSAESARRVAVLSSTEDRVLKLAYPAGDLFQAFAFFDETSGVALGLRGPRKHEKYGVPENVHDRRINPARRCDHGHYIFDPGASATAQHNQTSAAAYANAVLQGDPDPQYP